jgi:hypothetical protein
MHMSKQNIDMSNSSPNYLSPMGHEFALNSDQLAFFQQDMSAAFQQVLRHPQHSDTLVQFIEAFRHRAQFPWLGESGLLPGHRNRNGLAFAIRSALDTYQIAPTASDEQRQPAMPPDSQPLSDAWVRELLDASEEAIQEQISVVHFAHRLFGAGFEPGEIAPELLRDHIASALREYADRRDIGLAPDPF